MMTQRIASCCMESHPKSSARKGGSFCYAKQLFSPDSILFISNSTICQCIECYRHIRSSAFDVYLAIHPKIQRGISKLIGTCLASPFQTLFYSRNIAFFNSH